MSPSVIRGHSRKEAIFATNSSVILLRGGIDQLPALMKSVTHFTADRVLRERCLGQGGGVRWVIKLLQPVGGVWERAALPGKEQDINNQRQLFIPGAKVALHSGHGLAHQAAT